MEGISMTSMTHCKVGKLSGNIYTTIRLKEITEVFQDYKKAALFLGVCFCDWKCCKESGLPLSTCQNYSWSNNEIVEVSFDNIVKRIRDNLLTEAVVIGGLEPVLQMDEVVQLISYIREQGLKNDIVIYTGYYDYEIDDNTLSTLAKYNVLMKCGRYIPDKYSYFNNLLGVSLASPNQYVLKLSNGGIEYE